MSIIRLINLKCYLTDRKLDIVSKKKTITKFFKKKVKNLVKPKLN